MWVSWLAASVSSAIGHSEPLTVVASVAQPACVTVRVKERVTTYYRYRQGCQYNTSEASFAAHVGFPFHPTGGSGLPKPKCGRGSP